MPSAHRSQKSLILLGFKHCGKTTFGRLLAERLGWQFIDLDATITAKHTERFGGLPLTCREIYKRHGRKTFRDLERYAVRSLELLFHTVVATGSGVVLDPDNVLHLRAAGLLVFLDLDKQALLKRLHEHPLPSYLDPGDPVGSFEKVYAERLPIFEAVAEVRVAVTGRTDAEVLKELAGLVGSEEEIDG